MTQFDTFLICSQECMESTYTDALGVLFEQFRFLFLMSLIAILCTIEIGRQIEKSTSFKSFVYQTWSFLFYVFVYCVFFVFQLFSYAQKINSGVL
jgi:hypothetical protein